MPNTTNQAKGAKKQDKGGDGACTKSGCKCEKFDAATIYDKCMCGHVRGDHK